MDVRKRINARKIVLSYFYQHCFFLFLSEKGIDSFNERLIEDFHSEEGNDSFFDKEFIDAVNKKKEEYLHWDESVRHKLNDYSQSYNIEQDFPYILKYFFDQRSMDEVDVDYVLKVGSALPRYEKELMDQVNAHASSFSYEKMDCLDQVLLLLGYVEYKELGTPMQIVINEMVELAKRYADEGSPKLVNGILHVILSEKAG